MEQQTANDNSSTTNNTNDFVSIASTATPEHPAVTGSASMNPRLFPAAQTASAASTQQYQSAQSNKRFLLASSNGFVSSYSGSTAAAQAQTEAATDEVECPVKEEREPASCTPAEQVLAAPRVREGGDLQHPPDFTLLNPPLGPNSNSTSSWELLSPGIPLRVRSSNSMDAVIVSCQASPSTPSKWVTLEEIEDNYNLDEVCEGLERQFSSGGSAAEEAPEHSASFVSASTEHEGEDKVHLHPQLLQFAPQLQFQGLRQAHRTEEQRHGGAPHHPQQQQQPQQPQQSSSMEEEMLLNSFAITPISPRQFDVLSHRTQSRCSDGSSLCGGAATGGAVGPGGVFLVNDENQDPLSVSYSSKRATSNPTAAAASPVCQNASADRNNSNSNVPCQEQYFLLRVPHPTKGKANGSAAGGAARTRSILLRTHTSSLGGVAGGAAGSNFHRSTAGSAAVMHAIRKIACAIKSASKRAHKVVPSQGSVAADPLAPHHSTRQEDNPSRCSQTTTASSGSASALHHHHQEQDQDQEQSSSSSSHTNTPLMGSNEQRAEAPSAAASQCPFLKYSLGGGVPQPFVGGGATAQPPSLVISERHLHRHFNELRPGQKKVGKGSAVKKQQETAYSIA